MGDRRVPFYNVMNKILEEALVDSGWSPLVKRQPASSSPSLSSMAEMQEELNGRFKMPLNNNYITSLKYKMDGASVQTVNYVNNNQLITATPQYAVLTKKSMGEKRKERFLTEQHTSRNNNNYVFGLSSESSNQSHSQASFQNNRKFEIPEELRLLLKQSSKETLPLLVLDDLKPSMTCSCGGPIRIIRCRMCSAQIETNCFFHQAVGTTPHCNQPACYSTQLIELRNN